MGQMAGQVLQQRVPAGLTGPSGYPQGYGNPAMIPQQDLGYDAYAQGSGEYDGYPVEESSLLDPNDEYQVDAPENDAWEQQFTSQDPVAEEYEETDYEDSPSNHSNQGNPLAGLSTEQVQAYMAEWIDAHPNKNEVRQAAISLVGKVMK